MSIAVMNWVWASSPTSEPNLVNSSGTVRLMSEQS